MIKVIVKGCSIQMEGHAGYGPKGNDIVCSAASILMYTLARNLVLEEGRHVQDVAVEFAEGYAAVQAKDGKRAREMVRFTVNGLRLLAKSYPDCIQVLEPG